MTDQLTIPVPAKTWFVEVAEDWAVTAKLTHSTGPWIEYWWPTRNYLASSGRAVLGEPTRVGPFTQTDAAEYRQHLISKGLPQAKAKIREGFPVPGQDTHNTITKPARNRRAR